MTQLPELEERVCQACSLTKFKVLPTSTRVTCSTNCELEGCSAEERRRFLTTPRSNLSVPGPNRTDPMSAEQRRAKDAERKRKEYRYESPEARQKRLERKRKQWAEMPPELKKNETTGETSGEGITMRELEQDGTTGTEGTESEKLLRPNDERKPETQLVVLPPSPSSLDEVILQSDNILKDTAEHLFKLMKGLTSNSPDVELKSYSPEVVNSAIGCGSQIQKIMRLRLDAVKMAREME